MERKENSLSRRDFVRAISPFLLGTSTGLLVGHLFYNKLLNEPRSLTSILIDLSQDQQEKIQDLLLRNGALKVEVQAKGSELLAANAVATQTALDLLEYRVQATAEAYSYDRNKLEEIMAKLPGSLIHNSFKVNYEYSRAISSDNIEINQAIGSGIVTKIDSSNNTLVCLTTGHLLEEGEGYDVQKLIISQPHLGQEEFVYSSNKISPFVHPDNDIGIIVVNSSQYPLARDVYDEVAIDENWKPQTGEDLYSLSFPYKVEQGIGFTPSIFKVVEKEDGGKRVITNSVIGAGASGAPVVKDDGTLVGIFVGVNKLGSYVLPINSSYQEVLATTK